MKNFGKFTASPETLFVEGVEYKLVFQRNEAGEDMVDVLKAHPHAFYIAVDGAGRIVSMQSDPEAIQLNGLDIIGIDSDYGFDHAPGGNVYDAIWNGSEIIAPPVRLPDLTARQFWQAALAIGVSEEGLLASISDPTDTLYIEDEGERLEVSIDIRKATLFRRDYPLIDDMAAAYNIPQEQMNSLWIWAAQIE